MRLDILRRVPREGERVVYSTRTGRICPRCGWPASECRCAATLEGRSEPVPKTVTAKLRWERRASGKGVTVVDGLPYNPGYLEDLCRELKKACGAGGSVREESIALQGDQRERLRVLLAKKGLRVKG